MRPARYLCAAGLHNVTATPCSWGVCEGGLLALSRRCLSDQYIVGEVRQRERGSGGEPLEPDTRGSCALCGF